MTPPALVYIWDSLIGAVSYSPTDASVAVFEYAEEFLESEREVAPLMMPLKNRKYSFPDISARTFKGLPGMLADSLPDKFGNQLIDKHLETKGIPAANITAIDRLHYVGHRGMGALEYRPAADFSLSDTGSARGGLLDLAELTELASLTVSRSDDLAKQLAASSTRQAAFDLLRVGTSAGGARAKALIALDANDQPKVGHLDHGIDHTYWLLKFDGIAENQDRDRTDPPGMTVLEYIYSLIARECGIQLPRCRLLEQGDLRHFLIERFDRVVRKEKISKVHYTSWCGISHAHRDQTAAYSYEQLVLVMRQLELPQKQLEEIYRRAIFNVVGRNQDDHTKNFGFTMDRDGVWALSPAFDLNYAFDPQGQWTKNHQITLNGKGTDFHREDLLSFGAHCNLSARKAGQIIDQTLEAFASFGALAQEHDLPVSLKTTVQSQLRMGLKR